ncbi:peptidase M23 [Oceanobacillus zhaokaii]|uniref:Peptidase M23 n=1 Tax=Oceanobacillus zhaokaii TaxID=2052660 RepID=A0A345PLZ7_9BACI|nr:M23 family metallopeptidase [Oceanobacillus zhaokaii]AXI11027.1 peptidase M23 [Oceanobacillus zhaokaii]
MVKQNIKAKIQKRNKLRFIKKIAVTAFLGFGLMVTTASAEDTLKTVYHVYLDGEHIGKVDQQEIVEQHIEEKIATNAEKYTNLDLTIDEKVDYISEKVFDPTYNNEEVTSLLDENTAIVANAVELKIADRTVGYFENEEAVDAVVNAYKAKYVPKDVLAEIDAAKADSKDSDTNAEKQTESKLAIGEKHIRDAVLSDDVTLESKQVVPAEVLTEEQGVALLEKGTLEEKVHKVKEGEVLGKIASNYDLSTKDLLKLNSDLTAESLLRIGQEINVTALEPFVNVIVTEEELVEETIPYKTEIIESDDLYKGDEEVKQEGKDGKKEVLYTIEKTNGKQTAKEVKTEKKTEEAVKEVIIKGTKVIPSRGTGKMAWPAVGGYISSQVGERWGSMHKGLDIARPSNRSILAADNGVVVSAGADGSFGNKIVINHNNGLKTLYAHLSSIDVSVGQTVEKGSKIGVMGSTGNSTGIHLHFEVHKNGVFQNPLNYVK